MPFIKSSNSLSPSDISPSELSACERMSSIPEPKDSLNCSRTVTSSSGGMLPESFIVFSINSISFNCSGFGSSPPSPPIILAIPAMPSIPGMPSIPSIPSMPPIMPPIMSSICFCPSSVFIISIMFFWDAFMMIPSAFFSVIANTFRSSSMRSFISASIFIMPPKEYAPYISSSFDLGRFPPYVTGVISTPSATASYREAA
mmetsp:Transcript_15191/g.25239  ORF Transcript_15191/g.25239 Transcript_15191/m.25239 type:complete len:201 (+) Transcript_15191:109-711(+)